MTNLTIVETFNRTFRGQKNFLTPNVIRYGQRDDYYYELSSGKGMGDSDMFGVTVILSNGKKTGLSTCFDTQDHAEQFIKAGFTS